MPNLGLEVLFKGSNFARLLGGLGVALEISMIAVLISIPLGILIGIVMTWKNPVTKVLTRIFLEVMRIMPQLVLLFIVLIKETSVSCYIGLHDLTKGGEIIRSRTYTAFMPLLAVALIYLVIVMFFSRLVTLLERRLRYAEFGA